MADELAGLMRLTKPNIDPATGVLGRAFGQDPKMTYFTADTEERHALARHILAFELRYGIQYGEAYAPSPAMEGVAVWLPAEKAEITFRRAIRAGVFSLRRHIGEDVLQRILVFSEYIDAPHREHLPGPHWYLFFIGVDPDRQGKGVASRLVRPMLARPDREGAPCYLVTQNERNVPLYEHYGFVVLARSTIPGTDVAHIEMLREAAGKLPAPFGPAGKKPVPSFPARQVVPPPHDGRRDK